MNFDDACRTGENNSKSICRSASETRASPRFLTSVLNQRSPEVWRKRPKERTRSAKPGKPQSGAMAQKRRESSGFRVAAPGPENFDWSMVGGGRETRLQHSPAKWLKSNLLLAQERIGSKAFSRWYIPRPTPARCTTTNLATPPFL